MTPESSPRALLDLASMTDAEVHAHVRAALATPSGRVLRAWLSRHCFMDPAPRPPSWDGEERVAFRYGRMTLFQMLAFMEDPDNFTKEKRQ